MHRPRYNLMIARRVFPLLLLLCSAIASAAELPDAEKNAHPSDVVKILGTVPSNVDVVMIGVWRTSVKAIGCVHTILLAGTFQNRGEAPIQLESSSGSQRTWAAWRDYFKPGRCGWRLDEIYAFADYRDSGRPPERSSNLPKRIAYVCHDGNDCNGNNWAANDDNSKPVNLYCEFSRLQNRNDRTGGINPCALMPDQFRGADSGKYEHLLRPTHDSVLFRIVDLEDRR